MIDWQRVNELRDEIGPEDFGEVVELFLEEVETVIETLRAGNRTGLEQQLHFLKGSALNLGFSEFAALCLKGERDSAAGQSDAVDLAEILAAFDQSKVDFLSKLQSLA